MTVPKGREHAGGCLLWEIQFLLTFFLKHMFYGEQSKLFFFFNGVFLKQFIILFKTWKTSDFFFFPHSVLYATSPPLDCGLGSWFPRSLTPTHWDLGRYLASMQSEPGIP